MALIRSGVDHPIRVMKRQVRLHQCQVSEAGQGHRQSGDTVCTLQPADGSKTNFEQGTACMSSLIGCLKSAKMLGTW